MWDQYFRALRFRATWDTFERLPRNAAYKKEYLSGELLLTPRPRCYSALLDLAAFDASARPLPKKVSVRPLHASDWEHLPAVFAAAFARVQPFESLLDDERRDAARACIEHTRDEGDGPVVEPACVTALDDDGRVCGALLITMVPGGDPDERSAWRWDDAIPKPDRASRGGRPHLTWIFVGPFTAGRGVGGAMLASTVQVLRASGHRELGSSFLVGNDSSTLWHWHHGFRLLVHPGSRRRWEELFGR